MSGSSLAANLLRDSECVLHAVRQFRKVATLGLQRWWCAERQDCHGMGSKQLDRVFSLHHHSCCVPVVTANAST